MATKLSPFFTDVSFDESSSVHIHQASASWPIFKPSAHSDDLPVAFAAYETEFRRLIQVSGVNLPALNKWDPDSGQALEMPPSIDAAIHSVLASGFANAHVGDKI